MNRDEWIAAFAAEIGAPVPTGEEVQELLALAGVAAHASERMAAPISCWVAARGNVSPEKALDAAKRLAAESDRFGDAAS